MQQTVVVADRGGNLPSQADMRANPEETTTVQVDAHQQFVKLPMVGQNRRAIARSTDQGGN